MKKLFLLFLLPTFVFYSCNDDDDIETKKEVIVNLEDKLSTAESQYIAYTTPPAAGDYNSYQVSFKDKNNLVELGHYYASWGFAGGFTYTNKTDKTTPGFYNISAIPGKGKAGNVYLTVYSNSFTPAKMINLNPDKYAFKGFWLTNCTYAYLSVKDGNSGTGIEAYKFKAGDWFKLTTIAYSASNAEIGRADFYLADFRNGKSEIVNEWKWVDLGAFANASYLMFEMSSTDNNPDPQIGMNTPAYFCMDAITLVEK